LAALAYLWIFFVGILPSVHLWSLVPTWPHHYPNSWEKPPWAKSVLWLGSRSLVGSQWQANGFCKGGTSFSLKT
jgi:hypothetical protein